MRTQRYAENRLDEWERFVKDSCNGTIFNQRRFLEYHPPDRFNDYSLLFYDRKDKLVAVLPAAKVGGELVSHPGASYGGLIVSRSIGAEGTCRVVEALVRNCVGLGFETIELRPPPTIYQARPCEDLDYALRSHGFTVIGMTLSSVTDLRGRLTLRNDTERSKRKALREGVRVKRTNKWGAFWRILGDTLKDRHQAEPTHSLGAIIGLESRFPDDIRLFGAFLGEKLISGMVTFACNERSLLAFYYATDYEYQGYRPLNLVIPRVMEWAKDERYWWLDHGISTEEGGAVANWGLFRFKEGFGATGVVRRKWRKVVKV